MRGACCIVVLGMVLNGMAQELAVEAIHRDSSGLVVRLEREYRYDDGPAPLFVTVYSDGGRAIRRSIRHLSDTIMERNEGFDLPGLSRWRSRVAGSDYQTEATGGDSTLFEWGRYPGEVVFDTLIPKAQAGKFRTRVDRLEHAVAAMVHAGELVVEPEGLELLESWTWRTTGDELLDMVVSDENGRVTNRQTFQYQDTMFVARAFFDSDTVAYSVDSVSWDQECTRYVAKQYWTHSPEKHEHAFLVRDEQTLHVQGSDTVVCDWLYFNRPWSSLLRTAALREGQLCHSDLLDDREALLRSARGSSGGVERNEHRFDDLGRLVEVRNFWRGRLQWTSEYSYR